MTNTTAKTATSIYKIHQKSRTSLWSMPVVFAKPMLQPFSRNTIPRKRRLSTRNTVLPGLLLTGYWAAYGYHQDHHAKKRTMAMAMAMRMAVLAIRMALAVKKTRMALAVMAMAIRKTLKMRIAVMLSKSQTNERKNCAALCNAFSRHFASIAESRVPSKRGKFLPLPTTQVMATCSIPTALLQLRGQIICLLALKLLRPL